jgi:hypothetical protein
MELTAAEAFTASADAVLTKYRARCQALAERAAALGVMPAGPAKDAAVLTAACEMYRPAGVR